VHSIDVVSPDDVLDDTDKVINHDSRSWIHPQIVAVWVGVFSVPIRHVVGCQARPIGSEVGAVRVEPDMDLHPPTVGLTDREGKRVPEG